MLQNIGDKLKTHRWLSLIILGPLALIFAVWGVYGITNLDVVSTDYALKVNGTKISKSAVTNTWQNRQQQYQQALKTDLTDAQKKVLQEQVVQELIAKTLLLQRAAQLNLQTTDAEVLAAYRNEPAFQVDGKFNPQVARDVLASNGMTEQGFEASQREQLKISQIAQALQVSDFMTPTELKHIHALENEQRELRYAILQLEPFAAAVKPDDAAIQAWYDGHIADYQTQETARVQYAELSLDSIAAGVTVTPDALQAWYDKNKDRYGVPERRRASQILFTGDAALSSAQKALAEIRGGKDFAAAAKQYSQDPASASKGGDMGWIAPDAYAGGNLADFGAALYALKKAGEVSEPVKTKYGYHLIRLDQVDGGTVKTLASARAEIETDYRRDQAAELFGDRQEKLEQKLEGGALRDLAPLVKEFGLGSGEVAQFTRTGGGQPLPATTDLVRTVFDDPDVADGGRVGGPVALSDDRVVLVRVLQHQKPKAKPLADVRAEVLDAVRKDLGNKAASAAAQAAVKELQEGASFDAVLKKLAVSAAPAAFVERGDARLPVAVREATFKARHPGAKPTYVVVAMDNGDAALLQISAVKPGVAGDNPANDRQLALSYRQRHSALDLAAYLQELQRRATVKRNPAAFD